MKIALTSATVLPKGNGDKPREPSLLKGASRLLRIRSGQLGKFLMFVTACSLPFHQIQRASFDVMLTSQGQEEKISKCYGRRNATSVADDLLDNSAGLALTRTHCGEDLLGPYSVMNLTKSMHKPWVSNFNETLTHVSISNQTVNISRIEVDHLPKGCNRTNIRHESLDLRVDSNLKRLDTFLSATSRQPLAPYVHEPTSRTICARNNCSNCTSSNKTLTLILGPENKSGCESLIDLKQSFKSWGIFLVFDTLIIRPARVALLLVFNRNIVNDVSVTARMVLTRTLRQIRVDLAGLFSFFLLFWWYGARTVIIDWYLTSIVAVVEPELITVSSVFSRSKALIRESRCSSTKYVLMWTVLSCSVSFATYLLYPPFMYDHGGCYAFQTLHLIFGFSLWQKLARST